DQLDARIHRPQQAQEPRELLALRALDDVQPDAADRAGQGGANESVGVAQLHAPLLRAAFATFSRYQAWVDSIPAGRPIRWRQPSAWSLPTSRSLRGVPSGFVRSYSIVPSKPTIERISSASSAIEMSSPTPTFTSS